MGREGGLASRNSTAVEVFRFLVVEMVSPSRIYKRERRKPRIDPDTQNFAVFVIFCFN